jgi:hypothetical protein
LLAAALAGAGAPGAAEEAVVLKGGAVIKLKSPPLRRGGQMLLTRADGILLSVPVSEIDSAATRALKAPSGGPAPEAQAPAMTPAEAARAVRDVPKARVRITDADVSHHVEPTAPAAEGEKPAASAVSAGRVEVIEYNQSRSAGLLTVTGTLRNPGSTPATNVRMTVNAADPKGQIVASAQASVSNGLLEPGRTASFTANLTLGEGVVTTIRFVPQWITTSPPEEEAPAAEQPPAGVAPATAAASGAPTARTAPTPIPTPRFQGVLYAAPAPSASTTPPADGKTGYIPGPAAPENQPKPPE